MVSENAYHEIPYRTGAMAQTHPDRLAAVATLFGMKPAPASACRVLEIGCGGGGNLIPMAYHLPGSRFTGIDLAERAVAEGRSVAAELGLTNLELIAMDLCDIGPAMGEFDYIVVHGVYSWIPDGIRDRLLAVCRERLAPEGVVFVSYNALPGRYVRMMFRDMALYHTRNCADAKERIERARELLAMVRDARLMEGAWQPLMEEQIQQTLNGDESWFYHDDLAPYNDAFYVRDFVARATGHSLQYLGDAQPHLMFDVRTPLDFLGGDVMEREQYFDFLCLRPFRQTLLCRDDARLDRPAGPQQMDRFLFSSPAREGNGQVEGLHSVCLTEAPEPVMRVARAMGAVYPLPVAFDELVPLAGDREGLRGMLFTLISSGFALFHGHPFTPAGNLGTHPRATRLARWESAHTGVVTYSTHTANKMDRLLRALMELLDGTRDLDALASTLARTENAPALADIRNRLPGVLTHMWRCGLLEGE